jgi:hypothetical protein
MGWQALTNALVVTEIIPAHANPERSAGSNISVSGHCALLHRPQRPHCGLSADLVGTYQRFPTSGVGQLVVDGG